MLLNNKTPFVVFLASSIVFFAVNVVTQYLVGKPEIDLTQSVTGALVFGLIFSGYTYWKTGRK